MRSIAFTSLAIVLAAGMLGGVRVVAPAAQAGSPASMRDISLYITAKDGTNIAVDVWLPPGASAAHPVPALIKGTPYWRARQLTPLGYEKAPGLVANEPDLPILVARGYAVAGVDARGTGASFGARPMIFTDAEITDYGSIADWIVAQPWSNGNVGAYGFSYRGITAANIASLPNNEIKAVAPLFDLSDLYLLVRPGGVYEQYLLNAWSSQQALLNSGKFPCGGDRGCEEMIRGPKPVDADIDGEQLRRAISAHAGDFNVYNCTHAALARDDPICSSGLDLTRASVIGRKTAIEKRDLPMFAVAGWLDESSPQQALFRYRTFSNPQELVIGPFTHGGFENDDPFLHNRPLDLGFEKQTEMMADFFDRYLTNGAPSPIRSIIRYYVLGAGTWRTSTVWPPHGTSMQKWYPSIAGTLAASSSEYGGQLDRYNVDFSATTGPLSGYRGQVDLSKTDYGDRAAADAHLLTYTSKPLKRDTMIAGNPVAYLRLTSSATDGAVVVYIEDVAPKGRVTYISQGVLRLAFRKLAPGNDSAYSADPFHTYLRSDMMPMTPGETQSLVIGISPVAALIRRGHRLRFAISGADNGNLERVPTTGSVELTVERGTQTYLELPCLR